MLRHVSALTSLREWFGLRGEGRAPWAQSLSPYHPCRVSRARDNGVGMWREADSGTKGTTRREVVSCCGDTVVASDVVLDVILDVACGIKFS